MERVTVDASYICVERDVQSTGRIQFVARIKDGGKGFNLADRAKRAVARRNKVKPSAVTITGITSW